MKIQRSSSKAALQKDFVSELEFVAQPDTASRQCCSYRKASLWHSWHPARTEPQTPPPPPPFWPRSRMECSMSGVSVPKCTWLVSVSYPHQEDVGESGIGLKESKAKQKNPCIDTWKRLNGTRDLDRKQYQEGTVWKAARMGHPPCPRFL